VSDVEMTPIIPPSGWVVNAKHCDACGAENLIELIQLPGYSMATGIRNTRYMTVCPNRRWYKPWHHTGGHLIPPPPRKPRQQAAKEAERE
jgi:hypothetical protein